MDAEIRGTITRLLRIVDAWSRELEKLEPDSREAARMADSITKLLGRIDDFRDVLTDEEQDLVKVLSEKARRTRVKDDRVEAAVQYLRLAIRELLGEGL